MTGKSKETSTQNTTYILGWPQPSGQLNEHIEGCYYLHGLPRRRIIKPIPEELVDLSRRWKTFRQNNRRKQVEAVRLEEMKMKQMKKQKKYEQQRRRREREMLHDAAIYDFPEDSSNCEVVLPKVLHREDCDTNGKKRIVIFRSSKNKGRKQQAPNAFVSTTKKNSHSKKDVSPMMDGGGGGDPTLWKKLKLIKKFGKKKKKRAGDDDDEYTTEESSYCSSLVGEKIDDMSVSTSSDHSAETQPVDNTCRHQMELEYGDDFVDAWTAAKRGDLNILQRFSNRSYDWTRPDKYGFTPLHYGCQFGAARELRVAMFLLDQWIEETGQMPPKFVLRRCMRNAVNVFVEKLLEYPNHAEKILAEWDAVAPSRRYLFEGLCVVTEEPFLENDDWDDSYEIGEIEAEMFPPSPPVRLAAHTRMVF